MLTGKTFACDLQPNQFRVMNKTKFTQKQKTQNNSWPVFGSESVFFINCRNASTSCSIATKSIFNAWVIENVAIKPHRQN